MTKEQTKDIDLKGWLTQAEYARQYGLKLGTVSQWVKRSKEGDKQFIQFLDVPGIKKALVKPL